MNDVKQKNFDKVCKRMNDESLWDDIYAYVSDDHNGETYMIFDSHEDIEKFSDIVKDTLKIDNERIYIDDLLGVNVVFSDEYSTCDNCSHVIRISPDSYSWMPDYHFDDGFICNRCFNDDDDYREAYIEERINEPSKANTILNDEHLKELGFSRFNERSLEAGWYEGQNDNPHDIYETLKDMYEEILFSIDSVGQFDTIFSVWVRGEIA